MPYWTSMTPKQLRRATKADILKSIGEYIAHFTKRQIVAWLIFDDETGEVRVEDKPIVEHRPDHQIARREVIERDVLGKKVGSRETTYTYFDTGEVEDITIIERDHDDLEISRRTIRHFRDGRQPLVTEAAVMIEG